MALGSPLPGAGGDRAALAMVDCHLDHAIGEDALAARRLQFELVLAPAHPRPHPDPPPAFFDAEAVPFREPPPGLEGTKEAWLLDEGPSVLGAERVAVPAVVAEVLEVGDLMGLPHREVPPRARHPGAAFDAAARVVGGGSGRPVDEVGVVWAERG